MKKLFVILLVVALTLAVSVIASAATFSPYVGGEFQLTYVSGGTGTAPLTLGSGNNSMMKAYVQGRVEDADTNTWAQIGAKLTCWNVGGTSTANYTVTHNDGPDGINGNADDFDEVVGVSDKSNNWELLYSAGVKKVGGIMDIQFSTDDYEATLRGQTPLSNGNYKFGGDPYFTNRLNNAFGFDINTDNITVNIGVNAGVGGVNELGKVIVAAGTFKMDAGKVYVGYAKLSDTASNMIVGTEMKLGFGTLKADYSSATVSSISASVFQANVGLDEMKLGATLQYTMPPVGDSVIGVGVEYSGVEKLTLGVKYFAAKPDASYEVYGIIKAGVFDIRPGYAKNGAADGFMYLAAHVGMW